MVPSLEQVSTEYGKRYPAVFRTSPPALSEWFRDEEVDEFDAQFAYVSLVLAGYTHAHLLGLLSVSDPIVAGIYIPRAIEQLREDSIAPASVSPARVLLQLSDLCPTWIVTTLDRAARRDRNLLFSLYNLRMSVIGYGKFECAYRYGRPDARIWTTDWRGAVAAVHGELPHEAKMCADARLFHNLVVFDELSINDLTIVCTNLPAIRL